MDPKTLTSAVTGGGFIGLLAFVIFTGSQGYWVYGSQYQEMKSQRDEWKTMAVNATKAGERLLPPIIGMQSAPDPSPLDPESPEVIKKRIDRLEQHIH